MKVFGERLMLREIPDEDKFEGGIFVPKNTKYPYSFCEVVAIGNGKLAESQSNCPPDIAVGDTIFTQISPQLVHASGYLLDGKRCQTFPTTEAMSKVEPVYKQMRGWSGDVSSARTMDELPHEARNYIDMLELLIGVPITLVSVGAEREAMINRKPKIRRL